MSRRAVGILVAAVLTGLLFATVATSGGVQLWSEPQWEPAPATGDSIEIEVGTDELERDDSEFAEPTRIELPSWVRAILIGLASTVAILALIALLVAAWNRRPRLRWRPRTLGDDFDVLPDVAAAVVDEAEAQRAALLDGAPRNAIVQCWLRLEHDVAAAGLRRLPADTSAEFTERVLAHYSVDSEAIRELSALYREARFSEHSLDETARAAALAALDRLHRALTDGSNTLSTNTVIEGSR